MTAFLHSTLVAIAICLAATAHPASADEYPSFVVELSDGAITPRSIEVPANASFKLELRNTGSSPVEFESVELRKEKVLGPGVTSFVVIRRLNPGEYRFFDDFHPGVPPAMLIAKEPAIQ